MTEIQELSGQEKFDHDRKWGEELEQRLLTALEWSFPDQQWEKHNNCSGTKWYCKCFDLEDLAYQRTIECKRDHKQKHTGNMAFETYLADPSKCKADYLADEVDDNELYFFKMDDIRRMLPRFGKSLMGGDGKRTEMYVVEKKLFLTNVPHIRVDLTKPLSDVIFS